MMVPLTMFPAANGRAPRSFRASSIVSIIDKPMFLFRGDLVSAGLSELHCLTDQTLLWQRRLRVRFLVNFSFSASMNIRTHGVQAVKSLILWRAVASPNWANWLLHGWRGQ